MESNIVKYSDKIITVSPLASSNYIETFNIEKVKVETITNGYDEEDFKCVSMAKTHNEKFTILHNGLLYMIRTPETVLYAVRNLIKDGKIDKEKININFPWAENKDFWEKHIKEINLDGVVQFTGYSSHEKSICEAVKSDLLLLIIGKGKENRGVYTGKVFEYLRLCKPILALSPKGSVVEALLKETNRGENFEFDDISGIENYILKEYKKWEEGISTSLEVTEDITKYERRRLTEKLSNIFEELLGENLHTQSLLLKDQLISSQKIIDMVQNCVKNNDYLTAERII